MHTVELLEEALKLSVRLGYQIRNEWLGGEGGGDCEINGQKWIFIDLAMSPTEQLDQVVETLRREPAAPSQTTCPELRRLVEVRKSA